MNVGLKLRAMLRKAGLDIGRWPRPHDEFVLDGALAAVIRAKLVNCVFDVGANVGQFGRRVRATGYTGRIVSFEPSESALAILRRVVAGDNEWVIRPVGLGSEPGTARMHMYAASDFNSLHAPTDAGRSGFTALAEVGTATVTLSTLAAEHAAAVAGIVQPRILLKSDTQGHDLEVLAGDPGLPDVVAVLMELSAEAIYENQPRMTTAIDALQAQGFSPVCFQPVSRAKDRLCVIEFDGLFMRPG